MVVSPRWRSTGSIVPPQDTQVSWVCYTRTMGAVFCDTNVQHEKVEEAPEPHILTLQRNKGICNEHSCGHPWRQGRM